METKGRDIVLDFWRGIAILGVLVQHVFYFHYHIFRAFAETVANGVFLNDVLLYADKLLIAVAYRSGLLGVQCFFIISGYIITTLMLKEEREKGIIDPIAFYFRRVCRIIPPYAFYIVSLFVFGFFGLIQVNYAALPFATGFLCNMPFATCDWHLAHTWTLAIEEQFYIVWPLIFLFIGKKYRIAFVASTIAGLVVLSSLGIFNAHGWIDNPLSFACIALGALCALSDGFRTYIRRYGIPTALTLVLLLAFSEFVLHAGEIVHIAYRIVAPLFLLVAIVESYRIKELVSAQLAPIGNAIVGIGLISYSLYLWQEVFTVPPEPYPAGSLLSWPILMFAFAIFSYFVIEKSFIGWGKRQLKERSDTFGPGI
ncbi:acyltransferase [Candidatus Kaiserbacteria bacterium]|nr:acyltransferase [Candidatus Kaiserbacteria bacterium]